MQFEENPKEGYDHRIVFESIKDEAETVAAVYTEIVNGKAAKGKLDDIHKNERDFAMSAGDTDIGMLTNDPLYLAKLLEDFHSHTQDAAGKIARREYKPDFENKSVARRLYLGEKALEMAGVIRLKFDTETIQQEIDDGIIDILAEADAEQESAPDQPLE